MGFTISSKKIGEKFIVPQNYPGISRQVIDFVLTEYPNGEVLEDGEKKRVLWWFSAPIMHETSRMGTAYVLYDMVQDTELIETIKQTVDADISVLEGDQVFCLISSMTLPLDAKITQRAFNKPWISPVWAKSNFSETQWNKQFLFPIISGKP